MTRTSWKTLFPSRREPPISFDSLVVSTVNDLVRLPSLVECSGREQLRWPSLEESTERGLPFSSPVECMDDDLSLLSNQSRYHSFLWSLLFFDLSLLSVILCIYSVSRTQYGKKLSLLSIKSSLVSFSVTHSFVCSSPIIQSNSTHTKYTPSRTRHF